MSIEKNELKVVVARAISAPPFSLDSSFLFLQNAKIGDPVPLFNPEYVQDSWIIPFLLDGLICAISQVSLNNKLIRVSVFSSTPTKKERWFSPIFFREPPKQYMTEIKGLFQDYQLSYPLLTYDGSPAKWGWRLQVIDAEKVISNIFIIPSGWYVKEVKDTKKNYDGSL